MLRAFGESHRFLYASNGPSLGQWLFAHNLGGRLVAGAVKLPAGDDTLQKPGRLHAGEVIELRVTSITAAVARARLA